MQNIHHEKNIRTGIKRLLDWWFKRIFMNNDVRRMSGIWKNTGYCWVSEPRIAESLSQFSSTEELDLHQRVTKAHHKWWSWNFVYPPPPPEVFYEGRSQKLFEREIFKFLCMKKLEGGGLLKTLSNWRNFWSGAFVTQFAPLPMLLPFMNQVYQYIF